MSFVYQGPVDLVFIQDELQTHVAGLNVLLSEVMPDTFSVTFLQEQCARIGATRPKVTFPQGRIEQGVVTYTKPYCILFQADGCLTPAATRAGAVRGAG